MLLAHGNAALEEKRIHGPIPTILSLPFGVVVCFALLPVRKLSTLGSWKYKQRAPLMPMSVGRRTFLFGSSAATVLAISLIGGWKTFRFGELPVGKKSLISYKVGPMPSLPSPLRPPGSAARYLFADGRIVLADGLCVALLLHGRERLGFARKIPYGVEMKTDAEKLWLLGRGCFSPHLTAEIMAAHAHDPLYRSAAT